MNPITSRCRIVWFLILVPFCGMHGFAGVSRALQEQYKRDYENKAIFLKVPIYSEKQIISIAGQTFHAEPGSGTPRYKVGDQLRILLVDFAGEEIRFRLGAIGAPQVFVEIAFKFDANLQENFPNRNVFDRALQSVFTEGLKYTDIEDAKRGFVEEQFDRSVRELAGSASISRESVLKTIAPLVPAFQDAQRDNDNLRGRLQDISGQLSQSQSENRKLESELRSQQSEVSRLKSANASLQEKIDNSASQVSKLGDELRDIRGTAQGYQRELANLQRSFNLKVDSSRDLAMQIADLGQVMRKLQKDNESLANQISSLRTSLEAQQAANARLVSNNEELKASNKQMQSTINTLTSKEDSLARQYLDLKNEKERLQDFARTVRSLHTRVVEDKVEGGFHNGKSEVYLRNVLLGSFTWSIPVNLSQSDSTNGSAGFSAESIDYVRLTAEERHMLHTLGEKWKMKVDLDAGSPTIQVTADNSGPVHEVGERDSSKWQWQISNKGTQDGRLLLTARLVNTNTDEISFLQQEHEVLASNAIRQVRGYLQPIPLAVGALIGFLLFGIVGIFRKSKPRVPAAHHEPSSYTKQKEL
jgi:predicted nuclease with TOPRIM domain